MAGVDVGQGINGAWGMRCFIAIELPESVRSNLEGLSARLRRSGVRASWVRPENMHVTLRFLGEICEERVGEVVRLLEASYANTPPFRFTLQGTGAFPNMKTPSVIWAGIRPNEAILEVQRIAEDVAQRVGCSKEKNRFHPHVTLARIKDPRNASGWQRYLAAEKDWEGGEVCVEQVAVFQSELTPRGPIYTRLAFIQFSGGEGK